VSSLADLISGAITDRGTDMVEQAVFGTADSEVIASGFEEAVRGILMLQIDEVMFYETSVGCVVGLRLEHGSQVVMKAHQRRWSDGFLRATQHVQGFIAAAGFPCPRPLAGPTNVLGGLAVIESYLSDPGRRPTTEPMLAISAAGLARQINLCRGLAVAGLGPHPMDAEQDLYPLPHSPIFDFEATAAGAEWIDRLARAARTVRDEHV
jgi:hypothetical protein